MGMTKINWYPGHMKKTKEMIQESMQIIDIVLEIVDARIPLSSKNPEIEKYAKNIGLVYKELWRLDAQLVNNQNFTDHDKNGFIVRQTAIKYGFE